MNRVDHLYIRNLSSSYDIIKYIVTFLIMHLEFGEGQTNMDRMKISTLNTTLTQEHVNNINIIGDFLAVRDVIPKKTDAIILLGSSLIFHLDLVAEMYHLGRVNELIIVGGIGHSTRFLYDNLSTYIPYKKYWDAHQSEADIYYSILHAFYQIPKDKIIVENQSTNCGNNATYAYNKIREQDRTYTNILLIQDPTMQRRSYASFLKEWKDKKTKFLNYAPIIPELAMNDGGQMFFKAPLNPPWTIERYIELVMGEIPRLRDDENGYGPNGEGFIVHVDIPDEVEKAYKFLADSFSSV